MKFNVSMEIDLVMVCAQCGAAVEAEWAEEGGKGTKRFLKITPCTSCAPPESSEVEYMPMEARPEEEPPEGPSEDSDEG